MAGYIGSKASVTQVDGYNRTEADDRYVNASGDTMTGDLLLGGARTYFGKDGASTHWFATSDVASEPNKLGYGFSSDGAKITEHKFRADGDQIVTINGSGLSLGSSTNYGGKLSVNSPQTSSYAYLAVLRDASSGTKFDFQTYADPSFGTVNRYIFTGAYNAFVNGNGTDLVRIYNNGAVNVNYPEYTGNASQFVIRKDNPAGYNSSHLELVSAAGSVVLGFHAGGATAVCLDHVRGGNSVRCVSADRSVFAPLEASAFNVYSDYRLKENVVPLINATDRISNLKVHQFSFIEGSMSYNGGATVDGFLAHEVQEVVPEAVHGVKDAVDDEGNPVYQGIDQSKLVPLLTAALQEALGRIETLEAEVAALKGAANV